MREEEVRKMAKMAVMKEQRVKALEAQGVDPTYLAEMRNVDVAKLDMR